ncbi:enoyl-CoA hydratase/isomerase family protein [Rhodohalobacter mucosus]|uniref:Enoyl-CoA hydratase/isomerase family protein n=1 Tax=Rhodohalobacter mucosus TaxID=2079485 RepID=A0A316U3X1_9BACT|nr:enoyl-CoA hydratase/isomerase family protein [Rhodohalobacter mucosus]PWN08216.1 enoyl-CoA hydratase/isomerase family protein [Rhodohalobacter mucosus]
MPVSIRTSGHVLTAAIQRPDAMNAINFDVMNGLEEALEMAEQDESLRLFMLTGSGNSFIAGGDLKEFHGIRDAEGARKMSERMLAILERIEQLECWTLAAVNGPAYGGGWETLISFDFAVARESASFGFTQGKFYLPPGWGGLTRLNRIVGKKTADYWLASQKIISAEEALRAGLIQDVFPDDEYDGKLEKLMQKLVLNDRTFIDYMKKNHRKKITEELEPFSRFWESEEHIRRVEEFLRRGKK